MSIHHKVLTYTNPILQLSRNIGVKAGLVSPNRLRVLIYHDIPPNEEIAFASQLRYLKKHWNIISPERFEEMVSGVAPIIGDNLLITFDDGFMSNRVVAEKILKPLGIQAIFFIITELVSIDDINEAREFIAEYVIPGNKTSNIPIHWKNMQWSDLEVLLDHGHTIGGHTKKHTRLSRCDSGSDLENEIIGSADEIVNKLGCVVDHFAYTFGSVGSFSQAAMLIAKRRFPYIYSGVRGNNINNVSPFAIRRDAASYQFNNNEYVVFNNSLMDSFLGGFADFHYSSSREILDAWSK